MLMEAWQGSAVAGAADAGGAATATVNAIVGIAIAVVNPFVVACRASISGVPERWPWQPPARHNAVICAGVSEPVARRGRRAGQLCRHCKSGDDRTRGGVVEW